MTEVNVEFDNSIEKLSSANSATQSSITNLTTTNQQLAAQNQQLQMALAACHQQLMFAAPTQPIQWPQPQNGGGGGGGGQHGHRGHRGHGGGNGGWNLAGGNQQQQQQGQ